MIYQDEQDFVQMLRRTGWTRAPGLNGHTIVELVEAKIGRGEHLRHHDDLPGVHREVFGDVKDGFEDLNVVALDSATFEHGRRVDRLESCVNFCKR